MHFLSLLVLGAFATAQYNDGYETVDSATYPLQIRIAYQGTEAMMVSWNTFKQLEQPTVHYGEHPWHLDQVATSQESITYPTSLTYNNHVNITGLRPDTMYFYLPSGVNYTKPYSFKTGKVAGDMKPFEVAVVVDMGTFGRLGLSYTKGNGSCCELEAGAQTTIQSISERLDEFDFVLHPGDLGYADAWLKEETQGYLPNTSWIDYPTVYEHINNAFYDELENISSSKPYMVAVGNHECNCDNGKFKDPVDGVDYTSSICPIGQTNFTGYVNRFRMPSERVGGVGNMWYSYDHGMVHFVHVDTETDLGNGLIAPDEGSPMFGGPFGSYPNEQVDWLANDLASVDRKKTPWVIVVGHRPFYNSAGSICTNCTAAFEPLFYKYEVDLYFSGHSHVYCRNDPIYQNKTDPNGLDNPRFPWYIVNGAGGHYDGLDTLYYPLMPYTVYAQNTTFSWSKLIVHNCTHLTQQAIDSANGQVYDEATLFKDRECATGTGGWGGW